MTFLPTIDTKLNVWTLAAVLTALYTLLNLVKGWWRTRLGKRRGLSKAYRRMAPRVRHDYVKSLFGEPAWEHRQEVQTYDTGEDAEVVLTPTELTVRTWPLGTLGYLVTWSDEHDSVLMYSLTTRSRLFRPRVAIGPHRITLGRTPLASLPDPSPYADGPWLALGARRFSYAEKHYFGNPGGYLHWAAGVSDAGAPALPPVGCNGDGWGPGNLEEYRRRARINSVLVAGSAIDLGSVLPYGIAPDYDRVRLLETPSPRPGCVGLLGLAHLARRTASAGPASASEHSRCSRVGTASPSARLAVECPGSNLHSQSAPLRSVEGAVMGRPCPGWQVRPHHRQNRGCSMARTACRLPAGRLAGWNADRSQGDRAPASARP